MIKRTDTIIFLAIIITHDRIDWLDENRKNVCAVHRQFLLSLRQLFTVHCQFQQRKGSCLTVIRSKSQFWSILYIGSILTPPRQLSPSHSVPLSRALFSPFLPRPLFRPFNPHVHPVNYFVSGYLQRAVNSCRADYTDRFIALVSQSNVCNAPIPTTHSPFFVLFLSSFALSVFSRLFLRLLRVAALILSHFYVKH